MSRSAYIELYAETGLTMSQTDSILFGSADSQTGEFVFDQYACEDFFNEKMAYRLSSLQHTRISDNKVKVNLGDTSSQGISQADLLRKCDYMQICNNPSGELFGLFCFIVNVEYVSESCSIITFKVDPLITFQRWTDFGTQYIERCHEWTDNFGDNTMPENLVNVTEYKIQARRPLLTGSQDYYAILMYIPTDWSQQGHQFPVRLFWSESESGARLDSMIESCAIEYYHIEYDITTQLPTLGIQKLQQKMHDLMGTPENIIALYVCPFTFLPNIIDPDNPDSVEYGTLPSDMSTAKSIVKVQDIGSTQEGYKLRVTNNSSIDGYTPKNKKCLCYPFNYIRLITSNGDTSEYRYEFFRKIDFTTGEHGCEFEVIANPVGSPSLLVRPYKYKMDVDIYSGSTDAMNYANGIILNGYPTIIWTSDAFMQWKMQQEQGAIVRSLTSAVLSIVGGIGAMGLSGNPMYLAGGVGNAIRVGGNLFSEKIDAENRSDSTYGSPNIDSADVMHATKNIFIERICAIRNEIEAIDNFFTRNGYTQKKLLNMNQAVASRPFWNYVQTANANISVRANQEYKQEIQEIFNNGIRLWHPYLNTQTNKYTCIIGDYTKDNSPTS